MKKLLPFILILTSISARAQDIPLFSQKLTNSFIYNPAIAGHSFGSMTFSYKQNYKVAGAPENFFLSVHTPIAGHRFGLGGSVYQEKVNFLQSTYASGAFAYHVPINKLTVLSFGLAGEYNNFRINGKTNFDLAPDQAPDEDFNAYVNGIGDYDFSFGVHFQNRYLKAGIASNRMATSWIQNVNKEVLTTYYSSFAQGLIPLRGAEDLLEPYVAYRKFSDVNSLLDAGLFYTLNNKITFGSSMRAGIGANSGGNTISATLGFRLSKYLMIGYSRETILGNASAFVGSANEFSIRFDFNDQAYSKRFSSDYKSSVAYRRKTLSTGPVAKKKSGSRNPKQTAKKQKKLAPFSPNARYQNVKKLSVKTKKSGPKNKFSQKRKKPSKKKGRRLR